MVNHDDDCPPGYCNCPHWVSAGPCECHVFPDGCYPVIPLDPVTNDPVCGGWGTYWNPVSEQCECIDPSHEMNGHGDCVAPLDPILPPNPQPICPDPLNPDCDQGGGSQPPPPPPPADSIPLTLTLNPATVTPGGVTEVIVQVSPAQAGVPVEAWTSASGDGVGVFGASAGSTDANGQFSTTYTTALAVHVETIGATATSSDEEILVASADLTVGFGCGDERDHIILEYVRFPAGAPPPACSRFVNSTSSSYYTFSDLNINNWWNWAILSPTFVQKLDQWVDGIGTGKRQLNSGYRHPARNDSITGASSTSHHLWGRAADLQNMSGTIEEADFLAAVADSLDSIEVLVRYPNLAAGRRGYVHAAWQ